jgi:hypothetical protein
MQIFLVALAIISNYPKKDAKRQNTGIQDYE